MIFYYYYYYYRRRLQSHAFHHFFPQMYCVGAPPYAIVFFDSINHEMSIASMLSVVKPFTIIQIIISQCDSKEISAFSDKIRKRVSFSLTIIGWEQAQFLFTETPQNFGKAVCTNRYYLYMYVNHVKEFTKKKLKCRKFIASHQTLKLKWFSAFVSAYNVNIIQ